MGKPNTGIDAQLAEWRRLGLDFSEGRTATFTEIVPQTANTAVSGNCVVQHTTQHTGGVVVDVPPSVNHLFRSGGKDDGHRRFATKEYKKWIKANGWKLAALGAVRDYPVAVVLTVECKLRVGRDLDNLNKAVLDTMKSVGVLVDDDWRYVSSVTVRYRPCDGEGVRVTITKEKA